jgi:hypothetical protein
MIHCRFHKIIRRVVNSRGHALTLPAANPDVNNGDGTFTMATTTGNGNGKNWVCFLRVLRLGIGASDYIRGVN